jgi:hypothetical protein
MTTGKRFLDRTKNSDNERIIDARTRTILSHVLREERGRTLQAYLLATRGHGPHMRS